VRKKPLQIGKSTWTILERWHAFFKCSFSVDRRDDGPFRANASLETKHNNPKFVAVLKEGKNTENRDLPLLVYRDAFILPEDKNKAAGMILKVFLEHHWGNTWRHKATGNFPCGFVVIISSN
jgi:hypothetical protein